MKTFIGFVVVLLTLGVATGFGLAAEEKAAPAVGQEETTAPAVSQEEKNLGELSGTVEKIDAEKKLLTVQEAAEAAAPEGEKAGKSMVFAINDKTMIMDGSRTLSLEELEVGRQVRISYKKPLFGFLGRNVARSIQYE